MESKHTPGPWHRNIKPINRYPTIYAGRNKHIAIIAVKSIDMSEAEANARLIVAAPDLLGAAQAAWNCIAELSPTQARIAVAQMLQAAIEKATGATDEAA